MMMTRLHLGSKWCLRTGSPAALQYSALAACFAALMRVPCKSWFTLILYMLYLRKQEKPDRTRLTEKSLKRRAHSWSGIKVWGENQLLTDGWVVKLAGFQNQNYDPTPNHRRAPVLLPIPLEKYCVRQSPGPPNDWSKPENRQKLNQLEIK